MLGDLIYETTSSLGGTLFGRRRHHHLVEKPLATRLDANLCCRQPRCRGEPDFIHKTDSIHKFRNLVVKSISSLADVVVWWGRRRYGNSGVRLLWMKYSNFKRRALLAPGLGCLHLTSLQFSIGIYNLFELIKLSRTEWWSFTQRQYPVYLFVCLNLMRAIRSVTETPPQLLWPVSAVNSYIAGNIVILNVSPFSSFI